MHKQWVFIFSIVFGTVSVHTMKNVDEKLIGTIVKTRSPKIDKDAILEDLQDLIRQGADVNSAVYNSPPLHWACEGKTPAAVVQLLLSRGAQVNARNKEGVPALQWAAIDNNVEAAKLLIEAGADINAQDDNGHPPIYYAIAHGNKEVATTLIEAGCDTDVLNNKGLSLMYRARYTKMIEKLLHKAIRKKHGGSLAELSPDALLLRVINRAQGENDFEKRKRILQEITLLLQEGANIHASDEYGITPLHAAAQGFVPAEIAALLLKKGAHLEARNRPGHTPLHFAAISNNYQVAQLLIDAGAEVNAGNDNWDTPLHLAVERNRKEVTTILLNAGSQVNRNNNEGDVSLHKVQDPVIAALLLDAGAHPLIQNGAGITPLHVADNAEIIELLTKKIAQMLSREQLVETLRDTGVFSRYTTPLPLFDVPQVKTSLVAISKGDAGGITYLMWALAHKRLDVMTWLIKHGASPWAQTEHGKTVFDFAEFLLASPDETPEQKKQYEKGIFVCAKPIMRFMKLIEKRVNVQGLGYLVSRFFLGYHIYYLTIKQMILRHKVSEEASASG